MRWASAVFSSVLTVSALVDPGLLFEEMLYVTASFAGVLLLEYAIFRHHERYRNELEIDAYRAKSQIDRANWLRDLEIEHEKSIETFVQQKHLEWEIDLSYEDE